MPTIHIEFFSRKLDNWIVLASIDDFEQAQRLIHTLQLYREFERYRLRYDGL